MNATLNLVLSGRIKPVMEYDGYRDRHYLMFINGQVRRVPSEGHSALERAARHAKMLADYNTRRVYKRER